MLHGTTVIISRCCTVQLW